MSFNQVKELRKSGKLGEALEMAKEDLQAEPKNNWNKRAISWVYYEYLKKYAQSEDYGAFTEILIAIKELELGEDEKMFFDSCAWKIGSMIFTLQRESSVNYNKINRIFEVIKTFHFTSSSEANSFLYKSFHKGYKNWAKYIEFAEWWNFENFQTQDYLKESYKGKEIMSIAEQAYIAYPKKLLEMNPIDRERATDFMPKLDKIIEEHPEYNYTSYYQAKLLIALGDDDVLTTFLPFAKQKRNDFWVWDLLAGIFSDDKEKELACYCKGLSLNTPEDFLVKFRPSFAEILIEQELYDEAKTELKIAVQTRRKNEWRIPNKIKIWGSQDWFKNATVKENNKDFYKKHLQKAEEILYQDIPEEMVAVEFVNRDKKILNFVKDKERNGFFNYSNFLKNPQIGDLIKVRLQTTGNEGYYNLLSAKKASSNENIEAIKFFEGYLRIIPPNNFGFVEDIFVHPNFIEDSLENDQMISGKAMLSYNRKKNEWGWKAVDIQA